jgi:hypothetical protein
LLLDDAQCLVHWHRRSQLGGGRVEHRVEAFDVAGDPVGEVCCVGVGLGLVAQTPDILR